MARLRTSAHCAAGMLWGMLTSEYLLWPWHPLPVIKTGFLKSLSGKLQSHDGVEQSRWVVRKTKALLPPSHQISVGPAKTQVSEGCLSFLLPLLSPSKACKVMNSSFQSYELYSAKAQGAVCPAEPREAQQVGQGHTAHQE